MPAVVDERRQGDPRQVVLGNALAKAHAVAADAADAIVLAGDTEVVLDGRALGQPADAARARARLESLSGREHEVLGGLAVVGPDAAERSGVASSTVRFSRLSARLIDAYVRSGEWRGRAGGYAVQGLGSALVEEIRGDVSNVIGLPVPLLLELAPELLDPGPGGPTIG